MATLNKVILLLCQHLGQCCGPIFSDPGTRVKQTMMCLSPCRAGGHTGPSKMQAPSHVTCMIL